MLIRNDPPFPGLNWMPNGWERELGSMVVIRKDRGSLQIEDVHAMSIFCCKQTRFRGPAYNKKCLKTVDAMMPEAYK